MRMRRTTAAILIAFMALTAPAAAWAAYLPPGPPEPLDEVALDEATRRVLELERTIDDLKAEQVAIGTRSTVTAERIKEQSDDVDEIKKRLREAQDVFNARAVGLYKFTGIDELALLLDSSSFTELVSRATVLAQVLQSDRYALESASVVAAQSDFEAGVLEDLRATDAELRGLKDQRAAQLQTATSEQQMLEAGLSADMKLSVETARLSQASLHKRWVAASVPLDRRIRLFRRVVLPYTDRTYRSSEFHPHRFKTTGVTYNSVTAAYGPGFDGRETGSGQSYNQNDLTAASRNLPFGTYLALSRGNKRVIVVVNDRGPYTEGTDLEVSTAAAHALALVGPDTVKVEIVVPES